MQPADLLAQLSRMLWPVGEQLVTTLKDPLAGLTPLPGLTDPALDGRLLTPLSPLPSGNPLLVLLGEVLGDLTDGSPLRWHGWQREAGAERGLAAVLAEGDARAVLALSPGPVFDLVVTAGADLDYLSPPGDWEVRCHVTTGPSWQASFTKGGAAAAAAGSAELSLSHGPLTVGLPAGPNASFDRLGVTMMTSPTQPVTTETVLEKFVASVLPGPLQDLLGLGDRASAPVDVSLTVDRAEGLRFTGQGLRLPLGNALSVPGLSIKGFALELDTDDAGLVVRPTFSAQAALPALPIRLMLEGVGVELPISLDDGTFRVREVRAHMPIGLGVQLALPPVSGGGIVEQADGNPDKYRGLLDIDLGIAHVQAMGILVLPGPDRPLSFLVLLTAGFPKPGIQLGFGFALDAVGGIVGVNRRVDDEQLRRLVSDGNADQIMFPENALARAEDILGSLDVCFPEQRGQFLVGPMLQINWGGRLVTVSAAVILELPDPVRVLLLGRILIAIPDPLVPLIRLQASLLGRFDPAVPSADVLVSLSGSWVAGISVSGEMYVLFRGGRQPVFVLSAGGFHPQYVRPPGVPALRRLSMDLSGGILSLRAEAYLALTSNSLQFGASLHLDATIAGCGVEGYLGLDALFLWEPMVRFSVHVEAGVAVLAFGHRLASVALSFTLEGPGAWHAFGTGSISILFWDVDLDFDVRWGTPPALTDPPPEIAGELTKAVERREAWATDSDGVTRRSLQLTDDAGRALAAGNVALPDARLRLSQQIVPLDFAIDRFHRLTVPAQTWRIGSVKVRPDDTTDHNDPVQVDFVPGEFLAMTDDEQLGTAAFRSLKGGVELTASAEEIGVFADATEGYETAYEVDDQWFPSPPSPSRFVLAIGLFGLECFIRPLSAAERVDQWRLEQTRVYGAQPTVVLR